MPNFYDTVYGALLVAAGPPLLAARLLRRKPIGGLWEKLGKVRAYGGRRPVVWIHGVSVGEVRAAKGLVPAFGAAFPGVDVVISSTTPAGLGVARRDYPGRHVFYFPLDFSFAIRRVLNEIRPRLVVLMELEIWPNLLSELRARGIPVAVANGKLSERSFRGYRRLVRVLPDFLRGVSLFCVQSAGTAARLGQLGVPKDRCVVTGSLKYDNAAGAVPGSARNGAGRVALALTPEDTLVIGGSTHPGEEALLFDAFLALRAAVPRLHMIVAPRHLERLKEVEAEASARGVPTVRKSALPHSPSRGVILLDTMGELRDLYPLADAVVLGGTFAPVGGHNLVEPAVHGIPIVLGPHVHAIAEEAQDFWAGGGALRAASPAELVPVLRELLLDRKLGAAIGERARRLVDDRLGATRRSVEAIASVAGGCVESPHVSN